MELNQLQKQEGKKKSEKEREKAQHKSARVREIDKKRRGKKNHNITLQTKALDTKYIYPRVRHYGNETSEYGLMYSF